MNREEMKSFSCLTALPSDVISKMIGAEWLDQKMDALKTTSISFNQRDWVSKDWLIENVAARLRSEKCTGIWLIKTYPIWNEEAESGFLHIVVDGVFA